jgi:hypothetical protein
LRYTLGAHFIARLDYGWQLTHTGFNVRNRHRGHRGVTTNW